ncbi:hypothetical protein GY45DRAFT_1368081 [Cubamyces sp. BRFM 1775]|nr:hypothetical protein GY45DRAFT_1368081 [Cubamyces sp. BRFM 1775]
MGVEEARIGKGHRTYDLELAEEDRRSTRRKKILFAAFFSTFWLSACHVFQHPDVLTSIVGASKKLLPALSWDNETPLNAVCPQTTALAPVKNSGYLNTLEAEYATEEFRLQAYESLGGAIRVPYVADHLDPES